VTRPKELIRALERAGFFVRRVAGSHYMLKHPAKPALLVTVPFHNRDLKKGTLQSIVKQAGLTNEVFPSSPVGVNACHLIGRPASLLAERVPIKPHRPGARIDD
jgi:predicted RNA binding protein YcfA (HicA-like mRNA interferase family)